MPMQLESDLRSIGCSRSVLAQPTQLVGREGELDLARTMLLRDEVRLLTFKGPVGKSTKGGGSTHKVREEVELVVSDGQALVSILEGLGMRPWFRYQKFRTKYRLPKAQRWAKDLAIDLDETPIGTFVELEGPAGAIDRAAAALGFTKGNYIVANYFVLYLAECRRRGQEPGDMLFAKRNRGRSI